MKIESEFLFKRFLFQFYQYYATITYTRFCSTVKAISKGNRIHTLFHFYDFTWSTSALLTANKISLHNSLGYINTFLLFNNFNSIEKQKKGIHVFHHVCLHRSLRNTLTTAVGILKCIVFYLNNEWVGQIWLPSQALDI